MLRGLPVALELPVGTANIPALTFDPVPVAATSLLLWDDLFPAEANLLECPQPSLTSFYLNIDKTHPLIQHKTALFMYKAREHIGQVRHSSDQMSDRYGQTFILPYQCCLMVQLWKYEKTCHSDIYPAYCFLYVLTLTMLELINCVVLLFNCNEN